MSSEEKKIEEILEKINPYDLENQITLVKIAPKKQEKTRTAITLEL